MSFGLPVRSFPVTTRGEWKKGGFFKWIARRKLRDQDPEKYRNTVEVPSLCDVLLGRGKPFQGHPGNRRLHDILAAHYDEYNNGGRKEKTELAEKIVKLVKATPAKFLRRDEDEMWVTASDEAAREKVSHGFRRKRELEKTIQAQTYLSDGDGSGISGTGASVSGSAVAAVMRNRVGSGGCSIGSTTTDMRKDGSGSDDSDGETTVTRMGVAWPPRRKRTKMCDTSSACKGCK